jgi:hypothetical protein
VEFHEVVITKVQRNRSLKIFKLFAERIGEASQAAAVHTQCVILLFNMRRGNPFNVRHSRIFAGDNFAGTGILPVSSDIPASAAMARV